MIFIKVGAIPCGCNSTSMSYLLPLFFLYFLRSVLSGRVAKIAFIFHFPQFWKPREINLKYEIKNEWLKPANVIYDKLSSVN